MCKEALSDGAVTISRDGNYSIIERGGIRLIAKHPVLQDFAMDLARGLPAETPFRATVVVGEQEARPSRGDEPLIGIQTEHYLDASGQRVGRTERRHNKRDFVAYFDYVLDLSLTNPPAYEFLRPSRQRKITFGPYVFPADPVPRTPGGQGWVFAGGGNERRNRILASLGDVVKRLPRGTWGMDVHRAMRDAEAVLNVHQLDAVVTEAPRLLKAYMAGKPVVSEEMSEPIIMGRHVASLNDHDGMVDFDAVFDAFDKEIARKYRFIDFLEKVLGQAPA